MRYDHSVSRPPWLQLDEYRSGDQRAWRLTCTHCGTVQDLTAGPDGTKPDAEIATLTEQHRGCSAGGPAAG